MSAHNRTYSSSQSRSPARASHTRTYSQQVSSPPASYPVASSPAGPTPYFAQLQSSAPAGPSPNSFYSQSSPRSPARAAQINRAPSPNSSYSNRQSSIDLLEYGRTPSPAPSQSRPETPSRSAARPSGYPRGYGQASAATHSPRSSVHDLEYAPVPSPAGPAPWSSQTPKRASTRTQAQSARGQRQSPPLATDSAHSSPQVSVHDLEYAPAPSPAGPAPSSSRTATRTPARARAPSQTPPTTFIRVNVIAPSPVHSPSSASGSSILNSPFQYPPPTAPAPSKAPAGTRTPARTQTHSFTFDHVFVQAPDESPPSSPQNSTRDLERTAPTPSKAPARTPARTQTHSYTFDHVFVQAPDESPSSSPQNSTRDLEYTEEPSPAPAAPDVTPPRVPARTYSRDVSPPRAPARTYSRDVSPSRTSASASTSVSPQSTSSIHDLDYAKTPTQAAMRNPAPARTYSRDASTPPRPHPSQQSSVDLSDYHGGSPPAKVQARPLTAEPARTYSQDGSAPPPPRVSLHSSPQSSVDLSDYVVASPPAEVQSHPRIPEAARTYSGEFSASALSRSQIPEVVPAPVRTYSREFSPASAPTPAPVVVSVPAPLPAPANAPTATPEPALAPVTTIAAEPTSAPVAIPTSPPTTITSPTSHGSHLRRISYSRSSPAGDSYQRSPPRESKHLIIVLPPPTISRHRGNFGQTLSAGPSNRLSSGMLMPLYPTMYTQLTAIAKEFNFPSVTGLCLYLHFKDASGSVATPRISDESWHYLWDDLLESPRSSSPAQFPIAGTIEFDLDMAKARWYTTWIASSHREQVLGSGPSPGAWLAGPADSPSTTPDQPTDEHSTEPTSASASPDLAVINPSVVNPRAGRHVPKTLSLVERMQRFAHTVSRSSSPDNKGKIVSRAISPDKGNAASQLQAQAQVADDTPASTQTVQERSQIQEWCVSSAAVTQPPAQSSSRDRPSEAREHVQEVKSEVRSNSMPLLNGYANHSLPHNYRMATWKQPLTPITGSADASSSPSSVADHPSTVTSWGPPLTYPDISSTPASPYEHTPGLADRVFDPTTPFIIDHPMTGTSWGPSSTYPDFPTTPTTPYVHTPGLADRVFDPTTPFIVEDPATGTSWGPSSTYPDFPTTPTSPYVHTPGLADRVFDPTTPFIVEDPATGTSWGPSSTYPDFPTTPTSPYVHTPGLADRVFDPTTPMTSPLPQGTEHEELHAAPWRLVWPYRQSRSTDEAPEVVTLPSPEAIDLTTPPALSHHEPEASPLFVVDEPSAKNEAVLISLGNIYPHFNIYPTVYPHFNIYPRSAAEDMSSLVGEEEHRPSSPVVMTLFARYPIFDLYPAVYPHLNIYPAPAAEDAPSLKGSMPFSPVETRLVARYPVFDLYPAVYPHLDLFPSPAKDHALLLEKSLPPSPVVTKLAVEYPILDLYPAVYPRLDLYPSLPQEDHVPSSERTEPPPPLPTKLAAGYPIFDLYPAVYPYNLHEIYPSTSVNALSASPVTFTAYHSTLDSAVYSHPPQSSPISEHIGQAESVCPTFAYPVFVLYPPVYPHFELYPPKVTETESVPVVDPASPAGAIPTSSHAGDLVNGTMISDGTGKSSESTSSPTAPKSPETPARTRSGTLTENAISKLQKRLSGVSTPPSQRPPRPPPSPWRTSTRATPRVSETPESKSKLDLSKSAIIATTSTPTVSTQRRRSGTIFKA